MKRPADYHYPTLNQLRALKTMRRAERSALRMGEPIATARALIRKGWADHTGYITPKGLELVERFER